jgi:cobalt-zinc-cadmium efflux system outer membrane protein
MTHARVLAEWIWLAPLLAMAGCATYQDRPLSGSATLDAFESRTLDAQDLQAYVGEKLNVQRRSVAPWNLPALTLAAFFYNPELDVARAEWAVTEAERQTAAEYPNPTLSVAPGFNSTTGYGESISPWIVATALDIPIETAGKRGYRIAEAEHLSEAARLQIAQSAWAVRSRVRGALLDLYAAVETADLLRRRQVVQEDNVGLLEQLLELGGISANELGQARVMRDEARLAILDAEKQRTQARARLAAAIGVPARALESKELAFDAFETLPENIPPAEAQRRALLNRADLLAALAEYQASQSALQQEIARQFPDVQIGPGYEFDQSENKWSVGLSVTLPVFSQNQGAIAAAEARRARAEARFRSLQAQIVGDLEQAVEDYRASLEKETVAERLARELQAATDRIRKMYELGEVTRLEVDAAELESATGALNRFDARVETLRALGRIEDTIQVAADLPDWAGQIPPGRTESLKDQHHEE